MIGIYVIKSLIDNKVYIGSSKNITKRKGQHFDALRKNKHSNTHLQGAYNKYGENNFIFHTLEEVTDVDELIETENWWINSLPKDEIYNFRLNAETNRGIIFSEQARKNMSIAQTGKKQSVESIQKRSIAMSGRTVSDETKNKISSSNKGRLPTAANESTRKAVLQIDIITGSVIKTWNSMSEVEREMGIRHSIISRVCSGKSNSAGGFRWKYKLEDMTNE